MIGCKKVLVNTQKDWVSRLSLGISKPILVDDSLVSHRKCGSPIGGSMMFNRQSNYQPDFILSIIRMPKDWRPENVFDVPPHGKVVSRTPVASFDEAHDDLIRCNQIAIRHGLREWAKIEAARADA